MVWGMTLHRTIYTYRKIHVKSIFRSVDCHRRRVVSLHHSWSRYKWHQLPDDKKPRLVHHPWRLLSVWERRKSYNSTAAVIPRCANSSSLVFRSSNSFDGSTSIISIIRPRYSTSKRNSKIRKVRSRGKYSRCRFWELFRKLEVSLWHQDTTSHDAMLKALLLFGMRCSSDEKTNAKLGGSMIQALKPRKYVWK